MKNIFVTFCFCSVALVANAQTSNATSEINQLIKRPSALTPLRFLAADELMGRGTARSEINIAARYISEEFKSLGLKEAPNTTDYFQTFDITIKKNAHRGELKVADNSYPVTESLLQYKGEDVMITAPVLYIKHGTENDLQQSDVNRKIVVTEPGGNDNNSFRQGLRMIDEKRDRLQKKGAVAMIERFKKGDNVTWSGLQNYLTSEKAEQGSANLTIPVFIVNDETASLTDLNGSTDATLSSSGNQTRTVSAKNVIGIVEGTDPKLKNQYIVLSAHYDHLGIAEKPKMEEGKSDSIYNGARDNAIGVTAVLDAAKYFAQHPPKRSVLFIAYTAEEIGEIGSKYFAAHPVVPLKQMVYNLNIDNASYNDTTIVTVVGLGRTSADENIKKACAAYGLKAMPDPAPEQNLFDRSDNVNLAVKGIPAPTFSLGMQKFDDEINKRYHQLSDEAGNFDLNYAMKYIRSFILAAKNIADDPKQPEWQKGDKYEPAWEELYK